MTDRNEIAAANFVMDGERVNLSLARYDDDRFAMTGEYQGSSGQCGDSIRDDAGEFPQVERLIDLWDAHHLKVADDEVFAEVSDLLAALDGQRLGTTPDLDDAPDLSDDILDSRDVIRRLEIYRGAILHMGVPEDVTRETMDVPDEDVATVEEFIALRDLDAEGQSYGGDWESGATMIEDDAFVQYVEDNLSEWLTMRDDLPSWVAIDYEKTAAAVRQDYASVSYGDREFWVR